MFLALQMGIYRSVSIYPSPFSPTYRDVCLVCYVSKSNLMIPKDNHPIGGNIESLKKSVGKIYSNWQ